VPKPWTHEGHFPVEQNILLDAGGYAISKDDLALTEDQRDQPTVCQPWWHGMVE
jgi:hypothetical protein